MCRPQSLRGKLDADDMSRRAIKSIVKGLGKGALEGAGTSILGSLTGGDSDDSDSSDDSDNSQRRV